MPRVDDMLNKVARITWLLKLNLKKGFYRFPYRRRANIRRLSARSGENMPSHVCPLGLRMRQSHSALEGQAGFSSTYR